jgi:immunity protein 26 of polymorphic toxin system
MGIEYPFTPRSTSHLQQGQFWAVPLEGGGYGCGFVLARRLNQGKTDTCLFLAGLLGWFGESPPTFENIKNATVLEKGFAHIKAISETGGEIIGAGYEVLDVPKEIKHSDSICTWGYKVISKLAGKYAAVNK